MLHIATKITTKYCFIYFDSRKSFKVRLNNTVMHVNMTNGIFEKFTFGDNNHFKHS